jgi:PAS domain S-box-containing protein
MIQGADVMSLTVWLSLLSTTVFTTAAVVLIKRKNNIKLSANIYLPLLMSICLYNFLVVSNFLQHSGITDYFDPLEDIAKVVFTLVFLFFVNNWRKERSAARFRELFRLAPMSLAEVTMDGRIIEVNEILTRKLNEFFGITIDELPTLNKWWELALPDPEYREMVISTWQKSVDLAFETGAAINSEEREITCRDGTKRTMIVGASIIGENLLFSMVDITDRRQVEKDREKLQKKLLQSQKLEAIGILAGGVAHDFNNILGTIMGYAELTMEDMAAGDPCRENIAKILDATRRSSDLVRQLLIFARKQTITPILMDLNAAVESMHNMLQRLIGEDVELVWLPAKKRCTVKMDPSQLDQILINLCANARDAIADIGRITIKTNTVFFEERAFKSYVDCTPGNYVQLSIIDNGCGMDKETAHHVFDPFYTTKEVGQGTGLGLATVYGIVQQSHGFINLYSEPGLGTTFNIFIPLNSEETVQDQAQVPDIILRGKGETILMVEDEPALAAMSRMMLERIGYQVLTATKPSEAIQLARETSGEIHLFLTDVVMPEMNGRELIDQLLLIHPGAKHLFMSGYTADVIIDRGVTEEGRHFIQKPFSRSDIAVKVREVLDANGKQ